MPATSTASTTQAGAANASPEQRRQDAAMRRFIKALLRSGRAVVVDGGAVIETRADARVVLDQADLRMLEARGLVRVSAGICSPTPECAAWLRRTLASPDGFADQHRVLAPGPEGSRRDLCGNPLDRLTHLAGGGFLAPHQRAAGEKVCHWGARAQLRQRITMSYDPAQVGGRRKGAGSTDISDMAAEARKALARLFLDLPRDCAEVIVDVCVFEKGLQTIETERGWPRRSAKLVLRIGLDRLAALLGLSPEAIGQPNRRRRDWQDAGFQPTRFE